jgi:hypothetical protein
MELRIFEQLSEKSRLGIVHAPFVARKNEKAPAHAGAFRTENLIGESVRPCLKTKPSV